MEERVHCLRERYYSRKVVLLGRVVVESRVHLVVEIFHVLEVVHLGNSIEGVALENVDVGVVVALCVIHMVHMIVGMVSMD